MPSTDTLVRLVVALAVIASIGFIAATIADPIDPAGSPGTGPADEPGPGEQIPDTEMDEQPSGELPTFLEYLLYALVAIAGIALVWYLLYFRREAVKAGAVLLLASTIIIAVIYLLLQLGNAPELGGAPNETVNETPEVGGGDPGADTERETDNQVPPILAAVGLLAFIFIAGLLLSNRSPGDGDTSTESAADTEPTDDQLAVASAAGRAADRIDDAHSSALDNEVYRAWREMTDSLEVDRPETTTPGEFADAAVGAGLAREHVDELTKLFQDVRYGHEETTEARERRAVSILREIEDTYGDGEEVDESDEWGTDG
ncbi:DUF4129 domain-containing protein [Halobacteria archaeon AArc-curdl1]|uniref:DUF4129 domain-containing protein n=1 Tax=Natronosalvus hydrolyticus TaxID=2979988 RepID=A0AAP3E6S5_9EURY|nr:DUF4129 domain-containing protein [Halobacteria archaeon AArc-curdl1]